MKIKIDFVEANNYLNDIFQGIDDTILTICGEELKQILIDDYFNGADMAVEYIGYCLEGEYFTFDIKSN